MPRFINHLLSTSWENSQEVSFRYAKTEGVKESNNLLTKGEDGTCQFNKWSTGVFSFDDSPKEEVCVGNHLEE